MSRVLEVTSTQTLLVHTKLRRPRAVGRLVRRGRLLDLLHGGVTLPLTVVSAPAGYGKTTLVGLWLGEVDIPWAWYSIDEQDDTLDMFAAYMAAALARAYPGCGTSLQGVLKSPAALQPQRLADIFIGELDALPGELLLVLDDYHAITDPDIHSFMSSVIHNAPAGVHFVLLARSDPPLKLARLRARQQVLEIRAAQLRFTLAETRDLVQLILGDLATNDTVALFSERTEGWAAGIHLAATSMRSTSDAAAFASGFAHTSSILILEYLVGEVLEDISEQERNLLMRTAILERFCAPLCDAIMLQEGQALTGAVFLDRLRTMNLFLVELDEEGAWYRFHRLFADILRHRLRLSLDAAAIARLHGAASRWFEDHALIDEAIKHALSAGDPVATARLVETNADTLLNGENWRVLERWLALLPPAQVGRPALLAARGWVEQFRYRLDATLALAQKAEDRLERNAEQYSPSAADAIRGEIGALRAVANTFEGRHEQALGFAERALTSISVERAYVRGIAELAYLRATARLGRPGKTIEQANLWLRQHGSKPDARSLRLLLALCSTYYDLLELDELRATATSYRQLAEQSGSQVSIAWTRFLLGYIHYQRNELMDAERYFADVVQDAHEAHTRTVVDSWIGLALCLQELGKYGESHRQAAELRRFLLHGGQVELAQIADTLPAYLDLLAGEAVRLSDRQVQDLPRQLGLDLWIMPFHAWVLGAIRSGLRDQHAAVAAKLVELRSLAVAHMVQRRLLEIEVFEALLQAAQGDDKATLHAVRRAIAIAEPTNALRFFVDLGAGLKPYFHELAGQGVAPEFIARILAAFTLGESASTALAKPVALLETNPNAVVLPEMLSNRELDVLLLLDRRLSNKEIAEFLFVSPLTVKRHAASIYAKLHVDGRRAAVARAKTLGLIPTV